MDILTCPVYPPERKEETLFKEWYGVRNRGGNIVSLFASLDECERYFNHFELIDAGCTLTRVIFP